MKEISSSLLENGIIAFLSTVKHSNLTWPSLKISRIYKVRSISVSNSKAFYTGF